MAAAEALTPAQLADLADSILSVARWLALLGNQDAAVVQLSPLEALVIRYVDRNPGSTPSQLAAGLGLKSSNASSALRDLESKGFIRRSVDPADGRSVRIEPTAFAQENRDLRRQCWARIVGPLIDNVETSVAAISLLGNLDAQLAEMGRSSSRAEPSRALS